MSDEHDEGFQPTLPADAGSAPTIGAESECSDPLKSRVKRRLFDSAAPETIGRFEIVGKLGEGGMGIVYRARDPKLDRELALKLLTPEATDDPTSRARLQREAQAMAKMKHPNVAVVYEVGEHDNTVFIAMELIEGPTLRAWLTNGSPSIQEIAGMFEAIGEGLDAAHQAGLVHRDFKPDNVLVGDDGRPRVVDFGLARAGRAPNVAVDDARDPVLASPEEAITVQGAIAGTPAYMAPEQILGEQTDARTDQFAFCVALHEAVHGRRPHDETDFATLRESVLQERRTPPPPGNDPMIAKIDEIVARGLARQPEARFDDMRAIVTELETLARPPAARSHWRWAVPAAAAAMALAIGARLLWGDAEPARTARVEGSPTDAMLASILAESELPKQVETPLEGDETGVTVHRLANGLTVYLSPRHDVPTVSAQLVLRVGSAYDPPGQEGLAAVLARTSEHGTARLGSVGWESEQELRTRIREAWTQGESAQLRTVAELEAKIAPYVVPHEYRRISRELGVESWTTVDRHATRILARIPSSRVDGWLQLEAERVRNPVYRNVLGEIRSMARQELLDRDHRRAQAVLAALYPGSSLAHDATEIGPQLLDQTIDALERLHHSWYLPNNAALVLVGDIDASEVVPMVERHFGGWQPESLPKRPVFEAVPPPTEPGTQNPAPAAEGALAFLAWPLPWPTDPGYLPRVQAAILVDDQLTTSMERLGFVASLERTDPGMVSIDLPTAAEGSQAAAEAVRKQILAVKPTELDVESMLHSPPGRHAEDDAWFADYLARGYVSRVSWPDLFARVTKPSPDPSELRDALASFAAESRLVIAPPVQPKGSLRLPGVLAGEGASGPSPFAERLVASSGAPPEPQFLTQGRHFQRRDGAGGTIVASRCERGRAHLVMHFDFEGVRVPAACPAFLVGGFTWLRSLGLENELQASVGCAEATASIGLDLPAELEIPPLLSDPETWFQTPDRIEVLRTSLGEMGANIVGKMRSQMYPGLRHYALTQRLFAPTEPTLLEYFSARNALELPQQLETWAAINRSHLEIEYCGPDVEGALAAAPIDRPRTSPNHEESTDTWEPPSGVLVLDMPGPTTVTAGTFIPAGATESAPKLSSAMTEVLGRYLRNQVRDPLVRQLATEAAFELFSEAQDTSHATSLMFTMKGDGATVQRALEELADMLETGHVDAEAVARARAEVEHDLRYARTPPQDVPAVVLGWGKERTDPRMETWAGLNAATAKGVREVLQAFRGRPLAIALSGPLEEIDEAFLARFGPVERVSSL